MCNKFADWLCLRCNEKDKHTVIYKENVEIKVVEMLVGLNK